MKKVIATLVMLVLFTSAVFAVDVSGDVIGTVVPMQGSNGKGSKVTTSGEMNRVRLEGSGEAAEGTFGGWIRLEPTGVGVDMNAVNNIDPTNFDPNNLSLNDFLYFTGFQGYAYWQPVKQFKLLIGGNSDGFWGKEGVAGWMFYQKASDTGVVNPGNVWGGGYGFWPYIMRSAFYGGYGSQAAMIMISPGDTVDINIALPFFDGGETVDAFLKATFQVDIKLGSGNLAFTYESNTMKRGEQPKLFAYYGMTSGSIGLDFGLGYRMPDSGKNDPISIGFGMKFGSGDFGLKLRALLALAGSDKNMGLTTDVLPYFNISDNMRVFSSVGVGMLMPSSGKSKMQWHFNPYLEVGKEWGPQFYTGLKVVGNDSSDISWEVPVAIGVSF
jgi:hypothetical protein